MEVSRSHRARNLFYSLDACLWSRRGFRSPPPERFKMSLVKSYSDLGYRAFVETGTRYGDMLLAMVESFDHLWSIEMDPTLHRLASDRLAPYRNVEIHLGDSGSLLSTVLTRLRVPAVFWLDAHPGEDEPGAVPLLKEVCTILEHDIGNHVILIDDTRLLSGHNGWPSLEQVDDYLRSSGRVRGIGHANNIFRVDLT